MHTTERDLVDAIIDGVSNLWSVDDVEREVRSHGRATTDVVVCLNSELIAIEAKLFHWKRAIGQATLNRYCADRSYVAMWANRITRAITSEASSHGVGVLAVDEAGVVEVVMEAPLASPTPEMRARFALNVRPATR